MQIKSVSVASELSFLFGRIQNGDFNYEHYRALSQLVNSSASQQGGEQTRELVEPRIFQEIRPCTYRGVTGFFEKYFERKDWTCCPLDVYEAMKDRHVNGIWTDLPSPPVQAAVLDWWFRF